MSEKIRLIDVDGHNFPNLPLMKISAYHKGKGNDVKFYQPLIDKNIDKIYLSKVFDFTDDYNFPLNSKEIIKGGTGYNDITLDAEIENSFPDYSLYNIKDTAYGFTTRGCPRKCEFCIVSKKEGIKSTKVNDIENFWNGQKNIKLLDPNLLACKDHIEILKQLSKSKALIDFTQGLDARLLNEENTKLISSCKIKMIHFAWDTNLESDLILKNLKKFKSDTSLARNKVSIYILTNFDTSFNFDLERVYKIKELDCDPYIMVYDKKNSDIKYRKLQRWVNNKRLFRSCETFEEYRG